MDMTCRGEQPGADLSGGEIPHQARARQHGAVRAAGEYYGRSGAPVRPDQAGRDINSGGSQVAEDEAAELIVGHGARHGRPKPQTGGGHGGDGPRAAESDLDPADELVDLAEARHDITAIDDQVDVELPYDQQVHAAGRPGALSGKAAGQHVLVLGGTGTLRPAIVQLCRDGSMLSVVSRRFERLRALAGDCAPASGMIYGITADYQRPRLFAAALSDAVVSRGPFTAALLYCPGIADRSFCLVADIVRGRIVLLLTSQWAAPGRPEGRRGFPVAGPDPARFSYVVLGWKRSPAGTSWHRPQEISAAALLALRDGKDRRLGHVRPWDARPS